MPFRFCRAVQRHRAKASTSRLSSVSKGIFPQLSRLATSWESVHPSSNEGGGCGNTVRGKDCTPLWLKGDPETPSPSPLGRKWDIITFSKMAAPSREI